ncbi:MAG: indole-3-glycerol phosphate synthase TrpC [Actinomycetota bacterium]|nr:indole-3-glycerol phosphate synthase TrpC [Actinomycetota bacterium]
MATYLDDIVAFHRARALADGRRASDARLAAERAPEARPFVGALLDGAARSRARLAVVAEVKRRSPSKGDLAADLDPATLAVAYERGGAACLSVLTDGPHFGGSASDLAAARASVALPVLRKDFTVCESDVLDARAMGADAVLLIAAVLDDDELAGFARVAADLGMAALVEVHDEEELARALAAGATLVGVNQRDLHSFAVDTDRAVRVGAAVPDGVVKVAESGVRDAADAARLAEAGFDAVLVGESLVRAGDPERAVRELAGGVRCS